MTAVYIEYRPNDKVLITDAGIEGRVMRVIVGGNDAVVYEVQYWRDSEPIQYIAYGVELEMVESVQEQREQALSELAEQAQELDLYDGKE